MSPTAISTWLQNGILLIVVLMASPAAAVEPPQAQPERVTVRFTETESLHVNPGKGWMVHQRLPSQQPRLPCSVAYFRLNWEELEPVEGDYRWVQIDEAIKAWEKQGARIAFRIMTANAHTKGYYCSPKWLFDAGCRSYEYLRGGEDTMEGGQRIPRIEPDYSDPLFLKKHETLIRAVAARYDGHPQVEFLDIGSYGIWGEWHTPNGKPWKVRRGIIDMYLSSFHKTPLVSMSDDAEALAYSLSHGAGFRRDGVGSPWHEANWIGSKKYANVTGFPDQWKRAPVVFEWFGPYDFLQRRRWSFDRAVNFMLANHVTFINDNVGKVPETEWPKLQKLARLSGYRFVLREVSHPARVARGTKLPIEMLWSNTGVGKLYRTHDVVLSLVDQDGKTVCSQPQAAMKPIEWIPGDHRLCGELAVPSNLATGEYVLAVALVDPDTSRPAIRLAIDVPETGRLHHLTRIRVE